MILKYMRFRLVLFLIISILSKCESRGITSKLGASCLYVAANFTSFPFECEMPDLSFACRCQNQPFLGTVTNCIESHSNDPVELSRAYKQLVNTCKAQGGKEWNFIDLVKVNENATNYLMDYSLLPTPKFKASLVWKAQKIQKIQNKNNLLLNSNNDNNDNNNYINDVVSSSNVVFDPYAGSHDINILSSKNDGMIKNGKVIGIEKIPNFDNIDEIEKIGISNILDTPRYILRNPVIVPDELYNISHNSVSKLLDQRNLATVYGGYIYLYWGCVMLISMLVNISQWCSPYYSNRIAKTGFALWCKSKIICPQIFKPSNVLKYRSNSIANKTLNELVDGPMGLFDSRNRIKTQNTQTKLLSADIFDSNNNSKLDQLSKKLKLLKKSNKDQNNNLNSKINRNCKENFLTSIYTMPVRMHAIIILGYIVLNVVFCCIEYEIVYPNTVFTCKKGQKFVSIADRTGIIATVQLPLVYLFSTRNNIFSKLTGLSYRSFQMFHKWTSRVVFVLLVLHCSFYLMFVNVRGDYIDRWGLMKWRCANTAFIAICITMGISFGRKFLYEFFKVTHQLLLIIFSVCSWYHCLTLGWIEYLGVAYAIWGLEYLIRVSKIISSGSILKGKCKIIYSTAASDGNGSGTEKTVQSIRIEINHSGWWKPYPGCYCWVKFLRFNMFWEAHPFTVVSATNAKNYNQLVFVIRVKDGITKKLANHISKQPNGECSLNLLVEGPYGNNIPFKQYDKSILIAGGVGFAVIYSITMDLCQIYRAQMLRGKRNGDDFENSNNNSRKLISLIWVIPDFESLMSFKNEIESLSNYSEVVEVQIFITKRLKNEIMQRLIEKKKLVNPLSILCGSYAYGGMKGLANAIIESSRIEEEEGEGETTEMEDHCEEEKLDLNSNIERVIVNEKSNSSDLERCLDDAQVDQLREEIKMLEWLINNNNKEININFEDKPFMQDELCEFIRNDYDDKPIALIACGPTNLNVDVRLSAVKCLENGICVDYYEEELLW